MRWSPCSIEPLGLVEPPLAERMALLIEFRLMPYWNTARGLSSTRTAGAEAPCGVASPTPATWDRRCCNMFDAWSKIWAGVRVEEVSAKLRIGIWAGLNLRARGGLRMALGRSTIAAWMAD